MQEYQEELKQLSKLESELNQLILSLSKKDLRIKVNIEYIRMIGIGDFDIINIEVNKKLK